MLGSLRIIMDLPALLITAIITYMVYCGIKESKNAGNFLVGLKLVIIFLVIVVGAY